MAAKSLAAAVASLQALKDKVVWQGVASERSPADPALLSAIVDVLNAPNGTWMDVGGALGMTADDAIAKYDGSLDHQQAIIYSVRPQS
jgi:hypothetical protein